MLGARFSWLPLVVACSSSSPTQPAPSPPAPSAIIELGELTVRFDGNPIARLHADGRSESVGDGVPGPDAKLLPGPTFHADGTIELTRAGFTARVAPDGEIVVVSPPADHQPDHRFGRISGDQLSMADLGASVRVEGARLVTYTDSKPTNVLGVIDPPRLGRTALVMTAAFYIELAIKR